VKIKLQVSPPAKKRKSSGGKAKRVKRGHCCQELLAKYERMEEKLMVMKRDIRDIHKFISEPRDFAKDSQKKPKRGENIAEKELSDAIQARIERKRANSDVSSTVFKILHEFIFFSTSSMKWIKQAKSLTIHGVESKIMREIRDVLLRGPVNPRRLAIDITKRIWTQEYLKTRILGPQTRAPRANERSELVAEEEEKKLRGL